MTTCRVIPHVISKKEELQSKRWFPHTFRLDSLLEYALSFARQTTDCKTAFISAYTLGSDTVIITISFDNECHEDLISKSPLKYIDGDTNVLVESEAATMSLVERETQVPVPHVYGHASTTAGNPVGWPYILMSKAKGIKLDWEDIPAKGRETVMIELAKYMCHISRLSFRKIGSIIRHGDDFFTTRSMHRSLLGNSTQPFPSAKEYYTSQLALFHSDAIAPRRSSRVPFLREIPHKEEFDSYESYHVALVDYYNVDIHGHNAWDAPQNIARYVRLHDELSESLNKLVDLNNHEFILAHPDLNVTNIFIDPSTYEITCIIDWERASTVPIESFFVVPHLPNKRGPVEDRLRSSFIDAFGRHAETDLKMHQLAMLRNSEPMWAFDKLVQRDAGEYFHYAVNVLLRWKLGENWRDTFKDADNCGSTFLEAN